MAPAPSEPPADAQPFSAAGGGAVPIPSHLARFWRRFVAVAGPVDDTRFYEAFSFGDSPAMADELAALVLRGTKRATAGSLWSFEAHGKRLPVPGDLSIVTGGSGAPLCIIETRAATSCRSTKSMPASLPPKAKAMARCRTGAMPIGNTSLANAPATGASSAGACPLSANASMSSTNPQPRCADRLRSSRPRRLPSGDAHAGTCSSD